MKTFRLLSLQILLSNWKIPQSQKASATACSANQCGIPLFLSSGQMRRKSQSYKYRVYEYHTPKVKSQRFEEMNELNLRWTWRRFKDKTSMTQILKSRPHRGRSRKTQQMKSISTQTLLLLNADVSFQWWKRLMLAWLHWGCWKVSCQLRQVFYFEEV